ncbi:MAG: hypothetical protein WC890_02205 [Candidatus Margulisiibacteriota bacterium]
MAILIERTFQDLRRQISPRSLKRYFGPRGVNVLNTCLYQYNRGVVLTDERALRCLRENAVAVEDFVASASEVTLTDNIRFFLGEIPLVIVDSPDSKCLTLVEETHYAQGDFSTLQKELEEIDPLFSYLDSVESQLVTLHAHVHLPSWALAFYVLNGSKELIILANELYYFSIGHRKMHPTNKEAIEIFRWGTFYSANEAMQALRRAFDE